MSDIEKAARAIDHVLCLLIDDRKQHALSMMRMAYQCTAVEAREFVEAVERAYDLGN